VPFLTIRKCERLYAESPDNLTLDIGPSYALTTVLLILHGGAGALVLTLPLAMSVRVTLFALIGLSFYRSVHRHGLRQARDAVAILTLNAEGECALRRRGSAEWEPGRLVDWWVRRWLSILLVRGDGRRWPESVVICADAASVEGFRRLRVRLLLQADSARVSYRDRRSADRKQDNPE
jgi:hypothetical protein